MKQSRFLKPPVQLQAQVQAQVQVYRSNSNSNSFSEAESGGGDDNYVTTLQYSYLILQALMFWSFDDSHYAPRTFSPGLTAQGSSLQAPSRQYYQHLSNRARRLGPLTYYTTYAVFFCMFPNVEEFVEALLLCPTTI